MSLRCGFCALFALLLSLSLLSTSGGLLAADKAAGKSGASKSGASGSAKLAAAKAVADDDGDDDGDDDDEDDDEDDDDDDDMYAVPNGDSAKLLKFIQKISSYRPKDARDARAHRDHAMSAIQSAAKKIIEIETDKESEAYQIANRVLFSLRLQTIGELPAAEQRQFVDELFANLDSKKELGRDDFANSFGAAQTLEYSGPDGHALAAEVYERVSKTFSANDDAQIAGMASKAAGAARRLRLVGNTMKIKGTPVDGSKFDWDKYRGKVVLVDFWATWCGPCVAEMPNVLTQYKRYHDKGFDVVGISLDDEKETVQTFLKEKQIPWLTLNDGAQNEVADYYGIMGIPTVILVDKKGKVVSLNARGPELGKKLAELLGPASNADGDDDAEAGG